MRLFRQDLLYKIKYICYITLHEDRNRKKLRMQTTQLGNVILNSYAAEPKILYAECTGFFQQRQYLQQGSFAALLVTNLLFVSVIVS